MPDLAELFLPLPDDLLVNLADSRDVIDALLDSLLNIIVEYKDNVDQRLILPGVNWTESASVSKTVAKVAAK